MDTLKHAWFVLSCAGCGTPAAPPEGWTRRHEALLCPDCEAALASRSGKVGRNLASAEQEWNRLWREVDEGLDGSA